MSASVWDGLFQNHAVIALAEAQLCQDCNFISAAPLGACARCASKALLALAPVLDRKEGTRDAVLR